MTFDEWEKKFNEARKSFMDSRKINIQQFTTSPAALPLKAYSESREDLEQEIDDEGVKIAALPADNPTSRSFPYYRAGVEEAQLQREQERIMQRYNEVKQNAMKFDRDAMAFNRDDVKERILHEATKNGIPPPHWPHPRGK